MSEVELKIEIENKYGENLIYFLEDYSNGEEKYVDSADHEVYGEDDDGRDVSCTISTLELAGEAAKVLGSLVKERNQLRQQLEAAQLDVKRLTHERKCLAEAIGELAVIVDDTRTEFTGPDLLMVCRDVGEAYKSMQSIVKNAQEQDIYAWDDCGDLIYCIKDRINMIYPKPLYAHPPIPADHSEATEEMLSAGVAALERGLKLFPENYTQIVSNIWEDMQSEVKPS